MPSVRQPTCRGVRLRRPASFGAPRCGRGEPRPYNPAGRWVTSRFVGASLAAPGVVRSAALRSGRAPTLQSRRAAGDEPICRGVACGARGRSESRVAVGASPAPTILPGVFVFASGTFSDLTTRADKKKGVPGGRPYEKPGGCGRLERQVQDAQVHAEHVVVAEHRVVADHLGEER